MLESLVFAVVVAAACVFAGAVYGRWRLRTGRFRPEECVVWKAIERGDPLPAEADGEVIRDLLTRHKKSKTRWIIFNAVGLVLLPVKCLDEFLGGGVTADTGWTILFAISVAMWLWTDARRLTRIRLLLAQLDASCVRRC
ncbi:hypothetical protein L1080_027810 [Rhodococcus sp. MSC1_016]|jgi:hypothetical protein|uniref:hypothetical protein n=1 Tax=Rhodococcus sp. MSC1_016 TaxID=2909266 RepID=UPI00203009E1|nr:hypothetical protein [Rhodococcus sp. MSC1_016]